MKQIDPGAIEALDCYEGSHSTLAVDPGPVVGPVGPSRVPKLTARQRGFVDNYMMDFIATAAAIRAGYSERAAWNVGYELLRRPAVKAEIAARLALRFEREAEARERLIRHIERIVYADRRKLVNADGSCKAIGDLDDDTAAAVDSIDVQEKTEDHEGRRVTTRYTRIRLADRNPQIDNLAEILGLIGKQRTVALQFNLTQINVANLPTDPREVSLAYQRIMGGGDGS